MLGKIGWALVWGICGLVALGCAVWAIIGLFNIPPAERMGYGILFAVSGSAYVIVEHIQRLQKSVDELRSHIMRQGRDER